MGIFVDVKAPLPLFLILCMDSIIPAHMYVAAKEVVPVPLGDHCAFLTLTAVALSWPP